MPQPLEYDIQRAFTLWYKGERFPPKHPRAGQWKVEPAQLPGVVAWHTPNGGERRDAFEGKRLKESGVEPGIPDYLFLWGGLYGLEFKKPGGRMSSAQTNMHPRLLGAGMVACTTVDSLDAAKAFARRHGLVRSGC